MKTITQFKEKANQLVDESFNRKQYKKEINKYIATYMTKEKDIRKAIDTAIANAKVKLELLKGLPHTDTKPDTTGLSKLERVLAYAPYNNYKSIVLLSDYCSIELTNKDLKTIFRVLLEARVSSKSDSFIANIVIPKINTVGRAMTILQLLADSSLLELRKISVEDNKLEWMITIQFSNIEELIIKEKTTSKARVKFAVQEITSTTDMISRSSWSYEQPELSVKQMESVDRSQNTLYSLETTPEGVREAVLEKLGLKEGDKLELWQEIELASALAEYDLIMRKGNCFRISKFHDGVNRLYENSSYFGFQQSKKFRAMLRFHRKRRLTKQGIEALKQQVKAEPALADAMGWNEALKHPMKHTGVIVYQDATTQGTQLFGIATGSLALLAQGGAYPVDTFVKAYALLASKLNEELSIYYTLQNKEVTEIDCFTAKNVKGLHMTTLYNSGKARVLRGTSEDELEFKEDSSGKFFSLLETVRKAGLGIDEEDLWGIFRKSISYVSSDALKCMTLINKCVDETTLIYKWTSVLTGSTCQYAMARTEPETLIWSDNKGNRHQVTNHKKVLEAKSKWRGLAPRLIQGADADLLSYVLRGDYDVATIHDSFGSHPNDAVGVKERYRDGLIKLYEEDFMTTQLKEITGLNFKSLQNKNREAVLEGLRTATMFLTY